MQLWPSFNTVELADGRVDVATTFFSPREPAARSFVRPLVSAVRRGARWQVEPVRDPDVEEAPLVRDEAVFSLEKSVDRPFDVWDFSCARTIDADAGAAVAEYQEIIECARGSVCEGVDIKRAPGEAFPSLRLRPSTHTRYRLRSGLCRTLAAAERLYAGWDPTPFEWVGLLVRHRTRTARLVLSGLPRGASVAFGRITNLHTGRQQPHALRVEGASIMLERSPCAARQLLRIHWPLERG